MNLDKSVESKLDSIYGEEISLRNSQYQINRAFDRLTKDYSSTDLPEDIESFEKEADAIEENLRTYKTKHQVGDSSLEVKPNDIEAAKFLYSVLDDEDFTDQAIDDVEDSLESYFSGLESINGIEPTRRKMDVVQTLFHYISSFESEDGEEISPIWVNDGYRERKQEKLRNQSGESYELFEESMENFEGVFFLDGDQTSKNSAPLVEVAHSSTGNSYGLDNLEWWSEDDFSSSPEEREAVREGKEIMRENFETLLPPDRNHVYAFRGIERAPDEISDSRPTLEFMTLNPVFAYKWAGGSNNRDGTVIKEKVDLNDIWFWSNFSAERPISESAIVAEQERENTSDTIETDDFDLFKNAVKAAQQFNRNS